MDKWNLNQSNINSVKETVKYIRNKKSYANFIERKATLILQKWLDSRKIKNNHDSDNLLEK